MSQNETEVHEDKKIVVQVADASADPVVVSFPGGIPHSLGGDNAPQFAYRKGKAYSTTKGHILIGKDDTNLYQAESTGANTGLTKLCVALYNKNTGRLTLHQTAEDGIVFSVEQSVRSYKPDAVELPAKMTGADRRWALFESFGSSKKQRVLKSQAANVVNVDTVVGSGSAMMEAFLKDPNISESNRQALEQQRSGNKMDAVEMAYAEARRKFLPPFDVDAKEPSRVYDARDIAGDAAWGHVCRVTDACYIKEGSLALALTSRGEWYDSVIDVVKRTKRDSPNAKHEVRCAILLNHMIHFLDRSNERTLRGTTEEIAKVLKLPIEISARFLDLFTTKPIADDQGQDFFACSKQTRDKCRVYAAIIYLMAHGLDMKADNILPLAKDIKLEPSEAATIFRAAGCTVVSKGSDVVTAELTVPLTFPAPRRGRGGQT